MIPSATSRFLPAAILSALIFTSVGVLPAWAIALSWRTATSGGAAVAANWNPSQIPSAADTLKFNVGGIYSVSFPGTVPASLSHLYRSGTVTLTTTNHTVSSILRVGDASGDVGAMTLTTGTLTTGGQITIGNNAGSTGTVSVNDDDADLVQSGTTADIVVGLLGNGALNVTGGGLVDAAESIVAGSGTGHTGTVLVSGVIASPLVRSTIIELRTDGRPHVRQLGDRERHRRGRRTRERERRRSDRGQLRVAGERHGRGLRGSDFVAAHRGRRPRAWYNSFAGSSAGTGTLLVQNSGSVVVGGTTRIGDPDGGTGTLSVRPAGRFTTQDLIFDNTHGVFDFRGGTVVVDSGTFDPPGTTLVLDDVQFESLQLIHGASATFNGGSPAGYRSSLGRPKRPG